MTDNSQYPAKKEVERRSSSAPAKRPAKRVMSAPVARLADRLGRDADALKIDQDTLRRTRYPVLEVEQEDGRVLYKEDPGIEEGRRALTK